MAREVPGSGGHADGVLTPALRPGVGGAACAALGTWCALNDARSGMIAPWLLIVAAALACAGGLLAMRGRRRAGFAALALAAVLGCAGWTGARAQREGSRSLVRLLASGGAEQTRDGPPARVEGLLLEAPRGPPTPRGALGGFVRSFGAGDSGGVARFWLRADTLIVPPPTNETGASPETRVRASGRLWVRVRGGSPALGLRAGDRVRVMGRYSAPSGPENPGEADPALRARATGGAGALEVPSAELIERVGASDSGLRDAALAVFVRARASARGAALDWLRDPAPEARAPEDALLPALLLGAEESGYQDLRAVFSRLGVTHLLAISGVNMTALSFAALFLTRALLGSSRRWAALVEGAVVCAAVVGYTLVLPAEAPILRAALIAIVVTLAECAGRRYDRLNTLGWAFTLALLWRPTDLTNPGFQLSFGCVGALIALTEPLRERIFGDRIEPDLPGWRPRAARIGQAWAAASLAAWGVASPIVAAHFGVFTPLAPLVSLIVAPLTTALMVAGYAFALAGALLPTLGEWLAPALRLGASGLVRAVYAMDAPAWSALRTPPIPGAWAALAVGLFAWWALARRGARATGRIGRATRAARLSLAVGLALWLGSLWRTDGAPPPGATVRVDTLSVGSGTCHLVRAASSARPALAPFLRSGEAMLWDCGSAFSGAGLRDIPRACRALGAATVRTVVVSHPDLDHFVALPDAAAALGVRRVVVGAAFFAQAEASPDGAAATTLRLLAGRGVELFEAGAGDVLDLGAARLVFLSPERDSRTRRSDNDASLVARLDAPTGARPRPGVLFTGDIERAAMNDLLASRAPDLHASIMELPHHGSGSTAGAAGVRFVHAAAPMVVLQSTDPSRENDPRWDRARTPDRAWLVTSRDGALWAQVGRDGAVSWGSLRAGASGRGR